jgi:hypothetical protein
MIASFITVAVNNAAYMYISNWLWRGVTHVSELRPLQAYFSSPADCDVDHGMMVSTGANS